MNVRALEALARTARVFARCYVAVTEALIGEGVPEDTARREARLAALEAGFGAEEECDVCGGRMADVTVMGDAEVQLVCGTCGAKRTMPRS